MSLPPSGGGKGSVPHRLPCTKHTIQHRPRHFHHFLYTRTKEKRNPCKCQQAQASAAALLALERESLSLKDVKFYPASNMQHLSFLYFALLPLVQTVGRCSGGRHMQASGCCVAHLLFSPATKHNIHLSGESKMRFEVRRHGLFQHHFLTGHDS